MTKGFHIRHKSFTATDEFEIIKEFERSLFISKYGIEILEKGSRRPLSMEIKFKLINRGGHFVICPPVPSIILYTKSPVKFSFNLDEDSSCVYKLISPDYHGISIVKEYKNIITKRADVGRIWRSSVHFIEQYCAPSVYKQDDDKFKAIHALCYEETVEAGRVLYGHRNFIRDVYDAAKFIFGNIRKTVNARKIDILLNNPDSKETIKNVLGIVDQIYYYVGSNGYFPENEILSIIDEFVLKIVKLFVFYRKNFSRNRPFSESIQKFAIIYTHALLMAELKVIDLITERKEENIEWLKKFAKNLRPNLEHFTENFVIDSRDVENIFNFRIKTYDNELRIEYDLLFDSAEFHKILWQKLLESFVVFCRRDSY